jgi:hypothetical protein
VAYYDATNKDLKYLHKEDAAAEWSVGKVLDAAGDVGRFASLGVSARGYPNIAYYDADNQSLKFLSKTKKTAPDWDKAQVIATGATGQYASLVTSGFVDLADLQGMDLYNDGDVAVRVMDVSGWPFESGMAVHIVGGSSRPDHDFIQFLKRADNDHQWICTDHPSTAGRAGAAGLFRGIDDHRAGGRGPLVSDYGDRQAGYRSRKDAHHRAV